MNREGGHGMLIPASQQGLVCRGIAAQLGFSSEICIICRLILRLRCGSNETTRRVSN